MSEVYAYAGGMSFHLIYDAAADAAPQTFRDAIEAAAKQLSQAIRNQITVNLKIDISGTGGKHHIGRRQRSRAEPIRQPACHRQALYL
jgi:hypothetical protein